MQAVAERGERRLYTRTGDDISGAFPDVLEALTFEGAIDGELLVHARTAVAPFADLQQRLNRKTVDAKLSRFPAHPRLRPAAGRARGPAPPALRRAARPAGGLRRPARPRPHRPVAAASPSRPGTSSPRCAPTRPSPVAEGLMLKRWDSVYEAGRPKGPWFKWKRDPFLVDAVLMYAQRGHGKRSSYYSDYTFGVWDEGDADAGRQGLLRLHRRGAAQIDKFVRDNTVERFGPVRAVRAEQDFGLVFEVAFEGLQRSTRHKSGVAMRFPRISRIRWDKPPRRGRPAGDAGGAAACRHPRHPGGAAMTDTPETLEALP